jgi:t-SNARE complex subunit (syntaxin)
MDPRKTSITASSTAQIQQQINANFFSNETKEEAFSEIADDRFAQIQQIQNNQKKILEMFADLNTLLKDQNEKLKEVTNTTERSKQNMEVGRKDLTTAEMRQNSWRSCSIL